MNRPITSKLGALSILLAGCSNPSPPISSDSLQPPLPPLVQPPGQDPRFTPLPAPAAVIAALPTGRKDPFAPPQTVAKPIASQKLKAPALQLTGVAIARGLPQAFVSFNDESGAVVAGDTGGAGTPWLPPGWRVISINVQQGALLLGNGSQKIPFRL